MDEILKAVLLGVIQGLTEYLPISSTAHLRIIPSFFGWQDIGAAYTAVIQIGTMAAIILYFRQDLTAMFRSLVSRENDVNLRLLLYIIAGTIPIVICGYAFKDIIRNEFRNMYLITGSIIFFSIIMLLAERFSKQSKDIGNLTLKDGLFIGLFQAFALIPGASRSGSTISGALFRNMVRHDAARFSFLLSIPAVLLSGLYELYSERSLLFGYEGGAISLITATVVSGIVGYLSIWFMLSYLKSHTLKIFIAYRVCFALLIFILLITNIIQN